jgi:hypothetical protein
MDDDIIAKFEQDYRTKAGTDDFEKAKTNDIAEIRSVRQFIAWFVSWEFKNVLTWPFIYGMIFPLLLLDAGTSIYQGFCFRIYGIRRVERSAYFPVKRHRLGYLNIVEKINCDFCGYANGLLAFTREVFARTEQYWCPIKHAAKIKDPHARYASFMRYGETEGFQAKLERLRADLSPKTSPLEKDSEAG